MLRARIFLKLIPRFAILIGVSALALFLFSRMAGNVGQTLVDNYQADVAVQNMRVALARMDTALRPEETFSTSAPWQPAAALPRKRRPCA